MLHYLGSGLSEKYSPMIMSTKQSGMSVTANVIETRLLIMGKDDSGNKQQTAKSKGIHDKMIEMLLSHSMYDF